MSALFERLESRQMMNTYTVNSVADGGTGSLRWAIGQANANAGADTINFNIPGGGLATITPASQLPDITGPTTINGYSQPGSSPNTLPTGDNAVLRVRLDGTNVADALRVTGGTTTIRTTFPSTRWPNGANSSVCSTRASRAA